MELQWLNYPKGSLEHVCYLFTHWSLCAIYFGFCVHKYICTYVHMNTDTHDVDPGTLALNMNTRTPCGTRQTCML